MELDDFRAAMESYRSVVAEQAFELKESWIAVEKLIAFYKGLNQHECSMANRILSDWVLSRDEALRFDALALISKFGIVTAIPSLTSLANRLAFTTGPGAANELDKVNRLIQKLSERRLGNQSS